MSWRPLGNAIVLVAALCLQTAVGSGLAQQPRRPAPAAPASSPPEPDVAAPYEPQLLRLAEIMGALAWLRDLCGVKDGEVWRGRMQALVATESASIPRQERMAGAFNRGFRGYQQLHRHCTEAAAQTTDRFVEEGARLSRELANRFSG